MKEQHDDETLATAIAGYRALSLSREDGTATLARILTARRTSETRSRWLRYAMVPVLVIVGAGITVAALWNAALLPAKPRTERVVEPQPGIGHDVRAEKAAIERVER